MSAPVELQTIVERIDALLPTSTPDYPSALNGLQFANSGTVTRIAAAVDFAAHTVKAAVHEGANLLLVHHGMFWSGLQRMDGMRYERVRDLVKNDVAVYASHLPLDMHPTLGNNALLSHELGLDPIGTFGKFGAIEIGVRGETDLYTSELVVRATAFAARYAGVAVATPFVTGRRTRRWAVITGAGASSDTVREAMDAGVDTLIVGEGPHHTAVEAAERGLVIIYAGHYATETLGVRALATLVSAEFNLPCSFIDAPTGL